MIAATQIQKALIKDGFHFLGGGRRAKDGAERMRAPEKDALRGKSPQSAWLAAMKEKHDVYTLELKELPKCWMCLEELCMHLYVRGIRFEYANNRETLYIYFDGRKTSIRDESFAANGGIRSYSLSGETYQTLAEIEDAVVVRGGYGNAVICVFANFLGRVHTSLRQPNNT